jgi:hypothetical protein
MSPQDARTLRTLARNRILKASRKTSKTEEASEGSRGCFRVELTESCHDSVRDEREGESHLIRTFYDRWAGVALKHRKGKT